MGGCATKPKELKGESADAPMPTKNEAAGTLSNSTELVVAEVVKKVEGETVFDREKEIVEDDTFDEPVNRRRSLSNLFKENEGKDSTEHDMMSSDPVIQEEPSLNQKPTEVSEKEAHESGKIETPVEKMPRKVVEAPLEAKAEKAVEVAATTGTLAEVANESPAATEMQKSDENKLVEEKPDSETLKHEIPQENKAEEKPATENQKHETPA